MGKKLTPFFDDWEKFTEHDDLITQYIFQSSLLIHQYLIDIVENSESTQPLAVYVNNMEGKEYVE